MRITESKLRKIIRKTLFEGLDIHEEQVKQAIIQVVLKYASDDSGFPCLYESSFDEMHSHIANDLGISEEEAHSRLDRLFDKIWVPNPNFNNLKDAIVFHYLDEYIQGGGLLYYVWEMKVFKALGWDYDEDYDRFRKELLSLIGIVRLGM